MARRADYLADGTLIPVSMDANPTDQAALDAPNAKPRSEGRSLTLVLAISFLVYLTFGTSRVGSAILITSGNHSSMELGAAMALYSLAPLLMAIHTGAAAARYGPRWMVVGGSATLLGGAAIQAIPGEYVLLFPGALLCGIGFTALQISLQLHIGERCAPDERVRQFGYFSLTQSAATSLAALLSGYMSGVEGLRTPFCLSAVFAAVLLAVIVTNRHMFRSTSAQVPVQAPHVRDLAIIRLVGQRDIRTVLFAGALLAMAWDLHTFIVPFLSRTIKLSPSRIGVVLGLFSCATFAIRVCLPRISRRVSSIGIIRAALFVVGLCFAVYPWRTSYATMSVLAVFLGLALGTAQPNLLALVHDVAQERDVGRLIGFRTILLNIGSSLWPLCFGALGERAIGHALLGASGIFLLAGMRFSLSRLTHASNK